MASTNVFAGERRGVWELVTVVSTGPAAPGLAIAEPTPLDAVDEVIACDVVHTAAVATDLAIGLLSGVAVLYRSSATDAARPLSGVPVVLDRPVIIPPGWSLIGAANALGALETVTLRFLFRRRHL